MHSFFPSLLLAALASTAAGLPSFRGPFDAKRDSLSSAPFPIDEAIRGLGDSDLKAFSTGTAAGTGAHHHHHHHHHPTGTGGFSPSGTLAARQFSETGVPSFTGSFPTGFPRPTGTGGGFPPGTGFGGGFPTGFVHKSHSGTGFASPTGGVHNVKRQLSGSGIFPSMPVPTGTGFGGGAPTGGFPFPSGGPFPTGFGGPGSASPTENARNVPRQYPSGGFPSISIPTGTGFGGGFPTGGVGPSGVFPSGGFPMPSGGTGTGAPFPFPTTFQIAPSPSASG